MCITKRVRASGTFHSIPAVVNAVVLGVPQPFSAGRVGRLGHPSVSCRSFQNLETCGTRATFSIPLTDAAARCTIPWRTLDFRTEENSKSYIYRSPAFAPVHQGMNRSTAIKLKATLLRNPRAHYYLLSVNSRKRPPLKMSRADPPPPRPFPTAPPPSPTK